MDFIKLTFDKLSTDEIMELVTAENCGAVSLFVGTTRNNFEGKIVLNLEYEAYEGMAEKTMKQICNDIRDKWKTIENIAIYHRLGSVPVKESSVIIAISSPHRKDALDATQWCINTLKESVPIWKKEVYEEDEPKWKENSECIWSNIKNKINKLSVNFEPNSDFNPDLIQVNCTDEEAERRINTFIQRKREQINMDNIREFCDNDDSEFSCARVDAKFKRVKSLKSHLASQKVRNGIDQYYKARVGFFDTPYISDGVKQRLKGVEKKLNLKIDKPVSTDIYHRLKQIENRLLFLESMSPEYVTISHNKTLLENDQSEMNNSKKKQTYSINKIDNLLCTLESQI